MRVEAIAVTKRSLALELVNDEVYFAGMAYDVFVNDKKVHEGVTTNVVSVFGLEPDKDYAVRLVECESGDEATIMVRTEPELVRLDVRKFGAVGDGISLDSGPVQAAIMACPEDGTVWLPKGIYLCAPLFLKDDITIELEEGAVILGHTDRKQYPHLPGVVTTTDEKADYNVGSWEGNPLDCNAALITGINVSNVKIIGKGIIDGNAQNGDWWHNPKIKKDVWRPRLVFLNGCDNVMLHGVKVQNSPSWTLHPYFSENLSFIDIEVENPKDSPNTDGLDPESCNNIRIIGVRFSVGDDCIAIKAGKLYMGMKHRKPSENFEIRNCRMRFGHGAVVIGSEMSGGVRNIHVKQCLFEETDRGLRIKTRRGRGESGIIDHISFENIRMEKVLTPFVINAYYFCDPDGKTEYVWSRETLPVDEWTPYLGTFIFKNIDCVGSEVAAACFYGLPEQPIEAVHMEDVRVSFNSDAKPGQAAMMTGGDDLCRRGVIAEHVKKLSLKNMELTGYIGERTQLDYVDELDLLI